MIEKKEIYNKLDKYENLYQQLNEAYKEQEYLINTYDNEIEEINNLIKDNEIQIDMLKNEIILQSQILNKCLKDILKEI